jgi:hypothetical protein
MKISNLLLILVASMLIFACTSKDAKDAEDKAQIEEDTKPLQEAAKKIMPNLPPPNEYAAILHSTGAEFNPMILNDVANMPGYLVPREKAVVNLGVYFFDLGYSVAYQQRDHVDKYYDVCHNLAIELGIEKSFMELMMVRFEENIEQNDSLKAYFRDSYRKASNSMGDSEGERSYYRSLFLAGFYIEGLYNMLEVIESYPKDILPDDQRFLILMPLAKSVLAQEKNIKTLAEMLEIDYTEADNDEYYATSFRNLINTYEKLDVDDKIANNQGAELLNDEVMLQLMAEVDAIRSQIVKQL